MSRLRALRRSTRGTAAVEFAIIAGVLITLLVGTIDFGRTYYIKNQISYLADRAARRVLIDPDLSATALEAELRDGFFAGNAEELVVEIGTEAVGGNTYRVVTVGFPVTLFVPGLNSEALSLSVTRRVPSG